MPSLSRWRSGLIVAGLVLASAAVLVVMTQAQIKASPKPQLRQTIAVPDLEPQHPVHRVIRAPNAGLNKINHFIVIYQENWSFDGLYAQFPGANLGTNAKPGATISQVDVFNGNAALSGLVQPINTNVSPSVPDGHFTGFPLPVTTYDLTKFISTNTITGDIIHRFYTEQAQIDGGKMDKFVSLSDNPGLVLSQFDATNLPEGKLAQQYTMCDNFFHAAFGGSFLNHQWLIAAASPKFPNAPATSLQPVGVKTLNGNQGFDANSNPTPTKGALGQSSNVDNAVTPDGFVVNTSYTVNNPHPASANGAATLVPNQTGPHIGDLLTAAGKDWAWYSGGWNDAINGNPDPLFQFHHQPFAYFADLADGTAAKAAHLRDENQFFSDLQDGNLPDVSFIKPLGPNNEHPGYASLLQGQQHVDFLVKAIQQSPYWSDCAIIITYDEHGGHFDHVPPPGQTGGDQTAGTFDRWGPGSRVPTIIISPYSTGVGVDHTVYDTTSILATIEQRFQLNNLSTRDAAVKTLVNAFNFAQTPPVIAPQLVVAATATPQSSVAANVKVTFGEIIFNPGNFTGLSFSWNYGDTTTGTGAFTNHAYAAPGQYSAVLTVLSSNGNSVTSTVVVNVGGGTAALQFQPVAFPTTASIGQAITFSSPATSPTAGTTLTTTWNFGDGATGTGPTVTHAFATAGTYKATVTISDGINPTVTGSVSVTITSTPITKLTGTYSNKSFKGKLVAVLPLPTGTTIDGSTTIGVNGVNAKTLTLAVKKNTGHGKGGDGIKVSGTTATLTIGSISAKDLFGTPFPPAAGTTTQLNITLAGTTFNATVKFAAKGKTSTTVSN